MNISIHLLFSRTLQKIVDGNTWWNDNNGSTAVQNLKYEKTQFSQYRLFVHSCRNLQLQGKHNFHW
jgi:hypothetical protein